MHWPNYSKWRENAGRLREASLTFYEGCCRMLSRVWPFGNASRRTAPRGGIQEWADRLGGEKSFVLAFVDGMETEFLDTSEGLARLAEKLTEIQKACHSLTALTLGQSEDAAVQFAFQLLKKAEDLMLACYDQYDHVFVTFRELQQWLAELPQRQEDLMRVLLPLNVIATSFRMEASRRSPEARETFFMLAANVSRTVSEVRGTLDRQFEELAASERLTRKLIEQISGSVRQNRKQAAATLEASRAHLRSLNEALKTSGAGTYDLSHLNQSVTGHIGVIVVALQCQDATHQRIDHVGEAMDEMRGHLEGSRHANARGRSEARQFVFQASQIQLRQVQGVFDDLNSAAESITSGMQSLRHDSHETAEVALKVGGAAVKANVANESQASIARILATITLAVRQTADILAALEPLKAGFIDCSKKATELAREVRYVALNAQVFAIQTVDGSTLEVLAGQTRVISDEALQQVKHLGVALRRTEDMINNLRDRLTDFQSLGQSEQELLNAEAACSGKKLQELETAVPSLIRRITEQQAEFGKSIDTILGKIQFPSTLVDASSRAVGFLQDLAAWAGRVGAAPSDESTSSGIDRLSANYTMASERRVHTSALRAPEAATSAWNDLPEIGVASPANLPAPEIPGAEKDLGLNVELF